MVRASKRSVTLTVGLLVGALLSAPAFAHDTPAHTKKQINMIAKKIKQLKKSTYTKAEANARFFPGDELHTFGPLRMQVGAPSVPLLTAGPFSLVARCLESGGHVRGGVHITTSAAGSALSSNDGQLWPFGPGDGEVAWGIEEGDVTPGGALDGAWHSDAATVAAPDGTVLTGHTNVTRNIGGTHCLIAGHVFVHQP